MFANTYPFPEAKRIETQSCSNHQYSCKCGNISFTDKPISFLELAKLVNTNLPIIKHKKIKYLSLLNKRSISIRDGSNILFRQKSNSHLIVTCGLCHCCYDLFLTVNPSLALVLEERRLSPSLSCELKTNQSNQCLSIQSCRNSQYSSGNLLENLQSNHKVFDNLTNTNCPFKFPKNFQDFLLNNGKSNLNEQLYTIFDGDYDVMFSQNDNVFVGSYEHGLDTQNSL